MNLSGSHDRNEMPLSEAIACLNQFEHPALICEWACQPGFVKEIDGKITVIFPFAAGELIDELNAWLEREKEEDARCASFQIMQKIVPLKAGDKPLLNA